MRKKIGVIGATGTVGRAVMAQLGAEQVELSALSRRPEAADLPWGAEVVCGDLTKPDTLDGFLEGVEAVFLVWTAPPTAVEAALERIAKHVRRIVFLSAPHQTPHPLFQQPNPMAKMHEEIERVIEALGMRWTVLRPGMFAANGLVWWVPQIQKRDVVRWPYANAPTAPIHESDIGAAGARVLCDEGHEGKDYVLTGPESLSQAEQVKIIGEVIGRPLRMEEITPEEAKQELLAVIPAPGIPMLMNAWAATLGIPAYVTNGVEQVTGKPARSFRVWAKDHAGELEGRCTKMRG